MMNDFTITVVGTGVIGTSIGLALKNTQEPPQLVAHDKELSTAKGAAKKGAFDKTEWNLINACEQAGIVILAIPLNGIRPTLEAIAPYLQENTVVIDVCRSKAPVITAAQETLPAHVHFIGGDPIVYPTGLGYENGAADLFKDRIFCLAPTASAHEEAVDLAVNLVTLLGAKPFFLDAVEHDGLVAATEYLPNLIGAALLNTLAEQPSWRETRKLAGRLFEQTSAGAEGDPDSIKDGLLSNHDSILSWLDQYITELNHFRTLLHQGDGEAGPGEALAQRLDKAIVERHNWLADYEQNRFIDPELTTPEIDNPGLLKRWIGFGR